MTIRTNVSVSVFNIVRYIILGIVVDFIVRKSLDSFEHFRRRLSLHRGHPVSVAGHRIDRYNTLRILTSGNFVSGSILLLVTALAYTTELALEYAVDSEAVRHAVPGNVTRVEQERGICTREEMTRSGNMFDIALIADRCVMLEENTYRFYRPMWVSSTSANDSVNDNGLRVLCEPVEENILYEGNGVYSPSATAKGSPEVFELIHALSENSYKSFGDAWLPLVVLNVSSNDLVETFPFATPSEQFELLVLLSNVTETPVRCMGMAAGLHDTLMVQVSGCLDGFDEDSSLVLTYGSSFVEIGSGNGADDESNAWSTLVPFEVRTHIPRYFSGVRIEGSNSRANAKAYSLLLGRLLPQDVVNLNKYAIVYRLCDEVSLPIKHGKSWEEEYEFANSELRVTATVEEWAIELAVCWVFAVTTGRWLVSFVAAWKKMPDNVHGEQNILRRWAEESSGKQKEGGAVALMSVDEGSKGRRITATLLPV